MKTIDILINEVKSSEALQKLLAEAAKNNALSAFLKEQGCDATAEEFIAALKAQDEQLDDDALDAVAGGANGKEAALSLVSPDFACPTEAICSSTRKNEDGGDGRILCNA